jgi:hypothetical protein
MGLALAEITPQQIAKTGTLERYGFVNQRRRRVADAAAGVAQPVEEIDILATAAAELGPEGEAGALDQLPPQ